MKFYLLTDSPLIASEYNLFAIGENIFFKVEVFPKGFFISCMEQRNAKPLQGSEEITREDFLETIKKIEQTFGIDFNFKKNYLPF